MKISKNAFRFCKFGVMVLAWVAFFLKIKELVAIIFLILLFSAILKIKKAPMIILYTYTLDKLFPGKKIDLDPKAIRFAHILGSILSGICTILIYFEFKFGWGIFLIFAILKTISVLGFCPGEKIYSCMRGGCCSNNNCKK